MGVSMRLLGSPEIWGNAVYLSARKKFRGNVFDVFILMTSLLCPDDSIGMIFARKN